MNHSFPLFYKRKGAINLALRKKKRKKKEEEAFMPLN